MTQYAYRVVDSQGRECEMDDYTWVSNEDLAFQHMLDGWHDDAMTVERTRLVWEPVARACVRCNRTGTLAEQDDADCPSCGGDGWTAPPDEDAA